MSSGMEPHMRRVGCKSCAVWTEWKRPKEEWGKQHIHDQELIDRLATLWNRRRGLTPELSRAAKRRRLE